MLATLGSMADAGRLIHRWLPHALLIAAVLAAAAWLVVMLVPLLPALLLGLSLGLLTYPVVFAPVHAQVCRWSPGLGDDPRRQLAAALAVAGLAVGAALLLLLLLWGLVGRLGTVTSLIEGLLFANPRAIERAIEAITQKAAAVLTLYPDLPWTALDVRGWLGAIFAKTGVGGEFLRFLFLGSGSFLAQTALMTVLLFYLYAWGPALCRFAFDLLPLKDIQRERLHQRYRTLALHLSVGLFLRAAVHGIVAGMLSLLIAGFPPVAVGLLAAILALLPVVGPAVAWIPLATLLWSQSRPIEAVCLAIAATSLAWVIDSLARSWATRHGTDRPWLGFLVFLALVGGVLGFGFRGILLGPASVLAAAALAGFLPALYGIERNDPEPDPEANPPPVS